MLKTTNQHKRNQRLECEECVPGLWTRRLNIFKMLIFLVVYVHSQSEYQQAFSNELFQNFIWKGKRTWIARRILKKDSKIDFKTCYKATVIETVYIGEKIDT